MIQRCINPDAASYYRYGGRGIKVCNRWRNSYVAFLSDMGRKPSRAHSIERIDNDGDYRPGNCCWSLRREQSRNKSSNNNITAFGKRRCITDWAKDTGIYPSAIAVRLRLGWSTEDAVSIPPEYHEKTAITHNGETLTVNAWARRNKMSPVTIAHRLSKGVDTETALFQKEWLKAGRKTTKFLTVDGVSKSVEEWGTIYDLKRNTIEMRIKNGWSIKEAVTSPLGTRKFAAVSKLEHGTILGYQYHKCRCDLCKEAKRIYRKKHNGA